MKYFTVSNSVRRVAYSQSSSLVWEPVHDHYFVVLVSNTG